MLLNRIPSFRPALPAPQIAQGTQLSLEQAQQLWYGGYKPGPHSEKASHHGHAGLGSNKFATTANGDTMYLTISPLYAGTKFGIVPTRAMALDEGKILAANGNEWPKTEAELRGIIRNHPDCVIADCTAQTPPQTFA